MGAEELHLQPGEPAWYQLPVDEAVQRLRVDPRAGLGAEEVRRRREWFGPNVLREGKRRGPLRMLAAQFTDFMILILIAAAMISGLIGDLTDTIVILAIVVLNAAVGFIQEYRAERAVAALKLLAAPGARVVRDGEIHTLAAAALVPGDVVLLEAGNVVPADLRLTEAHVLKIDESTLTGESQAVEKQTRPLHEADLPLGDRLGMAYKGTVVTYGRARGVVVATGMQTELGKIAGLLHDEKDARTPLQKRLTRFGRIIAVAVLVLCGVMFGVGIMRGEPVMLMLLTAISLAVAAIPEALPAVVTVALALGARRMVRRNVLVRRLPAVETLGSVTYICSDKTGTLTENRMRAEEIYADGSLMKTAAPDRRGGEPWETLFHALALSNDARRAGDELIGDPTEAALYRAAEQAGYPKETLVRSAPRIGELPFDSERARMTTIHKMAASQTLPPPSAGEGKLDYISYTKGAPEKLLSLCRHQLTAQGMQAFDAGPVEEIVERMAADGLRVLAVAFRQWPEEPMNLEPETVERDLTFLGLVGLMDPPRAEAADAVALCVSAGITPVMITGDHPGTAGAIARRLHIVDKDEIVLTGQELARLSLEEFAEQVPRVRAYARVAPAQKIRIVQALQDRGEFVAMTGDGVNDAPALKRADIGIAMGKGGTDVAREASHMILLDDNFASIVAAVREGRRIFDNIRKFIKFIMTGNSGEILTLFLAPFLGLPIPLLPIHILWVNLVTDGLPGLALAVEPEERGIMHRPPRPPRESIFAHGMWQHIVWVGLLIAALCLLTQAWAIHAGTSHWQTMVFTVLTLAQMAHVLAVRSERDSLFTQGIFSNTPILGAVLLTFGLQLATIYVPFLNPIFRTQPLSLGELAFCLAMSSVVFFAVEVEKGFVRRGWLYNVASRSGSAR